MLEKTEAIVLRSLKYGEARIIVDMFTRQMGRMSFAIPLPKTQRSRLKRQYFQPLSMLNIECNVRQQAELQRLTDASILVPMASLLIDPAKLAISMFITEFLYHALKSEQQNEPLFDYIKDSLLWLDSCQREYANFHLVFLMRLSRFLGFYPNLEVRGTRCEDSQSLYFDLRAATFCEAPPLHRDFLMPQEAQLMRLMIRMDYPTMHLFRMNRAQRNRCLEVCLHYYRLHLPDFPELQSVEVLRSLFD